MNMKKKLAVMLVFGMVTAAVRAEFNVTGFASGVVAPFLMEGDDTGIGNGPSWGGVGPQVTLNAGGSNPSKSAGYMFSIVASLPGVTGYPVNPGQENYIWLKPFGDSLTFKAGGYNDYTLRGGSYFSFLFGTAGLNNPGSWRFVNEATIFSGFEARVDGGVAIRNPAAQLTFTPIPNLYFGGSFHLNKSITGFFIEPDKSAADYYIDGQYAIGYTINEIGQIRAQYIGMDAGRGIASYSNTSRLIQASFKLTILPNGPVEIGVTVPVYYGKGDYDGNPTNPPTDDVPDGYKEPVTVALGTDLAFGKFGIKANFSGEFGGAKKEKENTGMLFIGGVEPRYAITDKVTVAVPVGVTFQNATNYDGTDGKDNASFLDVGGSISLDLGASWNVNAGIVYANQIIRGDNAPEQKAKFIIPIYFSGLLF